VLATPSCCKASTFPREHPGAFADDADKKTPLLERRGDAVQGMAQLDKLLILVIHES
jgi:hypothetical protein